MNFVKIFMMVLLGICLSACTVEGSDGSHMNGGNADDGANLVRTLSWSAPTYRENGDPIGLEEIAGYEIKYKHSEDSGFTRVHINTPATEWKMPDLKSGEYLFQVAAHDQHGLTSEFSEVITFNVD